MGPVTGPIQISLSAAGIFQRLKCFARKVAVRVATKSDGSFGYLD